MAKKKKENIKAIEKDKSINKKRNFDTKYLYLLGILVITIIIFSGSFSNDFTNWDDDTYVTRNDLLGDLSTSGLKDIATSVVSANYHPLTILFLSIEFKIFGMNAAGFHYVSLLLHLFNIVLVFFLLQLLGFPKQMVLSVALLFAIHPMHVESVAWISEQKDLLYSLFYLASIISYLIFIKHGRETKWLMLSLVLFLFSLLSKSMAVTLPVILILIDWYLGRIKSKGIIREKIPYFALSIAFGIVAIITQSQQGATEMISGYSFLDRIFLASYAVLFYLFKLIVPINLSVIYYYPEKINNLLPYIYYLYPILLLVIVFLISRAKTHKKILIFGSLFFIVSISLVLQLIPVGQSIVSERYTYIPYLGLFLILSFYYKELITNKKQGIRKLKPLVNIILIAYLCILCVISYQRVKIWENGVSLFSDVIRKNPDKSHPYAVLANAYVDEQDIEKAMENFNKAIELNKENLFAYLNRGNMKSRIGKFREAIEDFQNVLRIDTNYFQAYTNIGICYKQMNDDEKALKNFYKAISINPEDVISICERAQIFFNHGNNDKALTEISKAIAIDKNYDKAYSIRGVYYGQNGMYKEAIADLNQAIELDPENFNIYINLGNVKHYMKDYLGAIEAFDKSIEINPYNPMALSNRGLAKYALGLRKEACNDWEKASKMGHQNSTTYLSRYCK